MNWKDILKAEKAHCGSEKTDEEEPIIEKLPDLSGDGEVTRKDVLIGRGVYDKQGNKVKKGLFRRDKKTMDDMADSIKRVLDEIEKKGGALGMKDLKNIPNAKEVIDRLIKERKIYIHGDGDIISIKKPSRGRGFTA